MSGEEQVRPPGKADAFAKSRAFAAAGQMPQGLKHWPDPAKPFDIFDSEVVQWQIPGAASEVKRRTRAMSEVTPGTLR